MTTFLNLTLLHRHTFQTPTAKPSPTAHTTLLLSLSTLLLSPPLRTHPSLQTTTFDVLALLTDTLPDPIRTQCIRTLQTPTPTSDPSTSTSTSTHHKPAHVVRDPRLRFLFAYGGRADQESDWLRLEKGGGGGGKGGGTTTTTTTVPWPLKWWEVIQDPAPVVGENDTFLSLGLVKARRC